MTLRLWLTAKQLRAWQRTTSPPCVFSPTPEGHAAFAAYLSRHAGRSWRLLLDLPGEEHAELPASPTPLSWLDRRAFLQQRLRDNFPDRRLRTVFAPPASRHHGPWRLASIDARMIDPWLGTLQLHAEQATGIHPLSALLDTSGLIPARFSGALQILADGVLRQFILFHGQPGFSRQIPLPEDQPPIPLLLDESDRLLQYLRLHASDENTDPPLLLIPPTLSEELSPQKLGSSGTDWQISPCTAEKWEQALLHALCPARSRPAADLSPPEFRRAARRARGERIGLAASGLLLAASLGFNWHARTAFDTARQTISSNSLPSQPHPHGLLPTATADLLQEMLTAHADGKPARQALATWAKQPGPCLARLQELSWRWPQRELQVRLAAPARNAPDVDCAHGIPLPGPHDQPISSWRLQILNEEQP